VAILQLIVKQAQAASRVVLQSLLPASSHPPHRSQALLGSLPRLTVPLFLGSMVPHQVVLMRQLLPQLQQSSLQATLSILQRPLPPARRQAPNGYRLQSMVSSFRGSMVLHRVLQARSLPLHPQRMSPQVMSFILRHPLQLANQYLDKIQQQ
jgi:hypothetical protein